MQQMIYDPTREQTRGINLVQGIVLHEVNEGAAMLDGRMQTPLAFADIAHQAYHFSVDANGIRAYVPITDATFAIGNVDTMSPWTVAAANPGIDPDKYTVNVAVLIGTASLPSPCLPGCGREYPPTLLTNLQELLAYIAEEAGLDLETPNIVWKHGTELCDLDPGAALVAHRRT
ncbi:MAG: N-acetylmuramoyl-L-alanine amidase [Cellvibrionales bacterium]|nr:N-acetylmuramoyl-L-alanine amidase [Cellvibrionales bacterium]